MIYDDIILIIAYWLSCAEKVLTDFSPLIFFPNCVAQPSYRHSGISWAIKIIYNYK